MYCPNCGCDMNCPCRACRIIHGNEVVWKWISDNGPIECGECGFTMPAEDWEQLTERLFNYSEGK